MAREGSDVDVRGVCIPPKPYLLGLQDFEQYENPTHDAVIFVPKKFVRLALGCDPNIIEILHAEPQHVLFINSLGERLRDAREIFIWRGSKLPCLLLVKGHAKGARCR